VAVRFIHLYLIVYFVLVVGAGLALWQAGAFARVPAIWVWISAIVTITPGIILAITSTTTTHE
jgi:hypothetical protein